MNFASMQQVANNVVGRRRSREEKEKKIVVLVIASVKCIFLSKSISNPTLKDRSLLSVLLNKSLIYQGAT